MNELHKLIAELLQKKKRPILFICGLGGSGKTTLAKQIENQADVPCIAVHSDWWAKYSTVERKRRIKAALDSGDPKRIEQEENPQNWYEMWKTLSTDLQTLQSTGRLTLHNAWNQKTGEKNLTVELEVPENGLIIFDGIYLLHSEIAHVADFIILLDVPPEICRKRSEERDSHRSSGEYLAYKAMLLQKYDVPYFKKYKDEEYYVLSNPSLPTQPKRKQD